MVVLDCGGVVVVVLFIPLALALPCFTLRYCHKIQQYTWGYNKRIVEIVVFAVLDGLAVLSFLMCCCAGCGMCCTKTPEDDGDDGINSKKKSKWGI